jgi:hypothetical protein
MARWSYEIVTEAPDPKQQIAAKSNGNGRDYHGLKIKCDQTEIKYVQTSETIVAESGQDALQYAIERLAMFHDRELIGIIRRHPIIDILLEKQPE